METDLYGYNPLIEINVVENPPPDTDFPTYDTIIAEQRKALLKVNTRKPQSGIQRILKDVFGVTFLYFATFAACDLIRKIHTGKWTRPIMSIIGPWNALTGAPLISKIAKNLAERDPLQKCLDSARNTYATCDLKYLTTLGLMGKSPKECEEDYINAVMACNQQYGGIHHPTPPKPSEQRCFDELDRIIEIMDRWVGDNQMWVATYSNIQMGIVNNERYACTSGTNGKQATSQYLLCIEEVDKNVPAPKDSAATSCFYAWRDQVHGTSTH